MGKISQRLHVLIVNGAAGAKELRGGSEMSDEQRRDQIDETETDVEGHRVRAGANDEPMEDGDEVEGHMRASTPRIDARVDARVE